MKRTADAAGHRNNDIPDYVVTNIRELLQKRTPGGYDLQDLGRNYFQSFKQYVYPEKFRLTWESMLRSPELSSFCELYNENRSVRWRKAPLTPVVNQNQLVPPGASAANKLSKIETASVASSYASSGRSDRSSGSGGSSSKRPSERSLITFSDSGSDSSSSAYASTIFVTTTPQNQVKLDNERSKIQWMPRDFGLVVLNFSTLIMERVVVPEAPPLYIDCTYADRKVLEYLMDAKGRIKRVSVEKYADVRNRYNEFEFERGAIFHHGAAIKMANIDALMEYGLSNPKDRRGSTIIGPNELLYFADVCGGPGGCAEYFLWKKKWHAKGFGISQRGKLDYNLLQAEHYPRESFEPYYGDNGIEGTGDIGNPYNVAKFVRFVRESTNQMGVHFCMASAGDRNDYVDEDQKEVRCKYIFMSELLIALQAVRTGGHYVCRVYDCYTPFTVGLIYLMYRCFEEVAIFKPESCLPASSERYIICKWKKSDNQNREIVNYLSDCHKVVWLANRNRRNNHLGEAADITHLISRERIKESQNFCDYIYYSNTGLGKRQYDETTYLLNKMEDGDEKDYVDNRLRQIQIKCNEQWQIPLECRQKPKYSKASTADLRAMKLVIPYSFEFYNDCGLNGEMDLDLSILKDEITSSKEWFFIAAGRTRGFFLSLGGPENYHFVGGKWNQVNTKMELMNNTLVYADLVDEVIAKGANQSITTGFHIIDALILGGNDIRNLAATERYDLIRKYAKSMNKMSRPDMANIRAKPRYNLDFFLKHMESVREDTERKFLTDDGPRFLAPVKLNMSDTSFYCAEGLVFMKSSKLNFAPADALFTLMNRFVWTWESEKDLRMEDENNGDIEMEDNEQDVDNINVTILAKYFAALS